MKKTRTKLAIAIVATVFLLLPSLAEATDTSNYGPNANGWYEWYGKTGDGFGIYYDHRCDEPYTDSYIFKVRLYVDINYSGARVTSCTYESGACYVPLADDNTNRADCNFFGYWGAEDKISSIVVVGIDPGWDVCFYTGNSYTGSALRLTSNGDDRTSLNSTFNDHFRSWRKRAEGTAC